MTWSSVVKNVSTNEYTHTMRTGHQLMQFLEHNHTLKVFHRLHSSLRRTNMSRRIALRLKMDLFDEYSLPRPFPNDMFLRLPNGSPDQAYLMLGQKETGRTVITYKDCFDNRPSLMAYPRNLSAHATLNLQYSIASQNIFI